MEAAMFCCSACTFGWPGRFACVPEKGTGGSAAEPAKAPAPVVPAQGQRWIDIHCHLFNILDLPALQFIERTRLSQPPLVRLPAVVVLAVLVAGLNGQAITARAELDALRSGREMRLMAAPTGSPLSTEEAVRILAGRERRMVAESAAHGRGPMAELFDEQQPATHARPALPTDAAATVRRAVNEILPGRNPDADPTDAELHEVAVQVEKAFIGAAGSFLAWANGMSRARNTLTGELLDQFPTGAEVLLVPAMVDYSRWLGIEGTIFEPDPIATLTDQVEVMAEIARRRGAAASTGRRVGLVSFIPFCPWRYLEDRTASRETMIDRLERWAANGHIVGVKLYPPMGFRPTGNAARPVVAFPQRLRDFAGGGHPGRLLDEALHALYATCERLDLAVMTHCGDSNEAADGFGQLADPRGWMEVLLAHPGLRLNLGHFGGVFSFADRNIRARETAHTWAARIASMITADNRLFADLGFGGQFLAANCAADAECRESADFIARLQDAHPLLAKRLMYGSDWVMVGMIPGGNDYAALAERSLERLFPGTAIENFQWRNAARFLGLGHDDAARQRIGRFLEPISPGLLARFDPDQPTA
jgi:predicted TIM-barrel fold metal-dependent hydrolase